MERIYDAAHSGRFPQGVVRLYATSLAVLHDISAPEVLLDDDEDIVRLGLVCEFWNTAVIYAAEKKHPFVNFLRRPGRRALVRALREGGGGPLLTAYEECRAADSLPEIAARFAALKRASGAS